MSWERVLETLFFGKGDSPSEGGEGEKTNKITTTILRSLMITQGIDYWFKTTQAKQRHHNELVHLYQCTGESRETQYSRESVFFLSLLHILHIIWMEII